MFSILADALMVATRQNPFDRKHVARRDVDHYEENRQRAFNLLAGLRA